MAFGRTQINDGMTVYSSDGEKLGKVIETGADSFAVEKGFFFPKDYLVSYADISRIDEANNVRLALTKDELLGGRTAGWHERGAATRGIEREGEVRVPLAEEELDVMKTRTEVGAARIHKEVHTEQKQFTVPVSREEIRVERTPAARAGERPAEGAFREETISVPVHEEEVEVRKRPVVREEVRVMKERHTEEHPVNETIRREEAEIDREGRRDKAWTGGTNPDEPYKT